MAELSQVLGSMLRDIARARVQSDVFSSEVSREYLGDEIMKMFPVPRAEIGTADVDMALAVSQVSVLEIDQVGTAKAGLEAGVLELSNRILSIPVRGAGEDFEPLGEQLADDRDRFIALIGEKLRNRLKVESDDDVDLLVSDPGSFADRVNTQVLQMVREAIKESERRIPIGQEPQEVLRRELATWAKEVGATIGASLARQEKDGVTLDVAITKSHLAEVPEAALSRVHMSVIINNYEWVEFEGTEGEMEQKLVER